MKKINRSIVYMPAVLAGIFFLSGCLGSGTTRFSSSVQFGFRLSTGQELYQLDSTIVSGSDTLTVKRVRFVFGADSLVVSDTTLAVFKDNSQWRSYSVPAKTRFSTNQSAITLFSSPIVGSYETFIFSVQRAPGNNAGIDAGFTSGGHHYSMIVEGTYNGKKYTYRSDETFTRSFPLGIDLPKYNVKYAFIVSANVLTWFSKNPGGGGGFYNPADANSSDSLDNLFRNRIKNSLHLITRSNQSSVY